MNNQKDNKPPERKKPNIPINSQDNQPMAIYKEPSDLRNLSRDKELLNAKQRKQSKDKK